MVVRLRLVADDFLTAWVDPSEIGVEPDQIDGWMQESLEDWVRNRFGDESTVVNPVEGGVVEGIPCPSCGEEAGETRHERGGELSNVEQLAAEVRTTVSVLPVFFE